MSQIWHKDNTVHVKMVIFNKWCMRPGLFKNQRPQHRRVDKYDTFKWAVEQISKFLQRRFREVGFRIPEARFRIPKAGFRIPKAWIPDYKGKNMLDSGFRIPLHGAIPRKDPPKTRSSGKCQVETSSLSKKLNLTRWYDRFLLTAFSLHPPFCCIIGWLRIIVRQKSTIVPSSSLVESNAHSYLLIYYGSKATADACGNWKIVGRSFH